MQLADMNFVWWGLSLVGYLFLWLSWKRHIRRQLLKFSSKERLKTMSQNLSAKKRMLKMLLILGILGLLTFTGMGPEWGKELITVEKKGRDLLFVVDVSRSMLAEDILPSRLEKVKIQLNDFTYDLLSDRVGIVLFAGSSFVFCPLTLDYGALRAYIDTIHPDLIRTQGTLLAKALLTAKDAFIPNQNTHKVIILLTDGEDHGEGVIAAIRECAQDNIRIFAIGIGSKEGSLIPITGDKKGVTEILKDAQGKPVLSRLNDLPLKQAADLTQGKYYHSPVGNLFLTEVYDTIQKMIRQSFGSKEITEYIPRYQIFLLLAVLLLLMEGLISERTRTRR